MGGRLVLGVLLGGLALGMGWSAEPAPFFKIGGEARARYESLDGRFRNGFSGSDQALFTRGLFHVEAGRGAFSVGLEIQDSRGFFDDEGSPVSGSFVNASDVLQAYGKFKTRGVLGKGSAGETILGRQTISISSKRQLERVSYANVIRGYTGMHHTSTNDRGDELHLVAAVPVARQPRDQERAIDNRFVADQEQWQRKLFGIHYRRQDAVPGLVSDLWAEAFVYGLYENDGAEFEGPDRKVVYPGFRLYRPKKTGRWDIDLEPSVRVGTRRATSDPNDTEDLDVFATRVIAILGRTFDLPWQPRLAAEWFWASGDEDPNDGRYGQYERFFGSRRTDLNNTSLHGPLTYANLNAPGARFEAKPNEVTDIRVVYSASYLASSQDRFVIARLQDPTGQSGTFTGHAIDTRARYLPKNQPIVYEVGASAFLFGQFTEEAPGATGDQRTLFGYVQATWTF